MMSVFKDVLKMIGYVIFITSVIILAIYLAVTFGYFIGTVIANLPFLGGWLVDNTGVSKEQIPNITAWIAIAVLLIGVLSE